jgi:hypothetical protein
MLSARLQHNDPGVLASVGAYCESPPERVVECHHLSDLGQLWEQATCIHALRSAGLDSLCLGSRVQNAPPGFALKFRGRVDWFG